MQQYDLMKLEETAIPSDLDALIATVSPLFHGAFVKKWICKLISL